MNKKHIRILVSIVVLVITSLYSTHSKNTPSISDTSYQLASIPSVNFGVATSTSIATSTENDSTNLASKTNSQDTVYKVKKVIDGDTIQIEKRDLKTGEIFEKETIRLIGINTPETVDPRKKVECFGKEASLRAKELLVGQSVRIETDATQTERDKYGRLLAYMYLEDGRLFNRLMLEEGYAYEYTYNKPYRYQTEFKEAQLRAQQGHRGLWAENTCNGTK